MVRWRVCLVLAMLLVLPALSWQTEEEDEDDKDSGDPEEEDDKGEEDEEENLEKKDGQGKRTVHRTSTPKSSPLAATRTVGKRPPECFTCAYNVKTSLRACLDPAKFKVHSMTCHNIEDKCFTAVISKGNSYESVVRGCRTGCVGTAETTCCEFNRCNNQAFAMPLPMAQKLADNKSSKTMHPSVFFFVTILLVLQTVVKVSFV